MGASFGVGVTHLCLMLGSYFSQSRNTIALVEWKNQDSFTALQEAYEGKQLHDEPLEEPFRIKKVDYYKQFSQGSLSTLKDGSYQVIVVDFGEVSESKATMFNEMDIKLLVGHGNEWKYKEIEAVLRRFDTTISHQWKVVLPFSTQEEIHIVKKITRQKIRGLSYCKDPFRYDETIAKEIEQLLSL